MAKYLPELIRDVTEALDELSRVLKSLPVSELEEAIGSDEPNSLDQKTTVHFTLPIAKSSENPVEQHRCQELKFYTDHKDFRIACDLGVVTTIQKNHDTYESYVERMAQGLASDHGFDRGKIYRMIHGNNLQELSTLMVGTCFSLTLHGE